MTILLSRKIDGKKFMWDGATYDDRQKADEITAAYQNDGFETELIEEDGQFLVYSRRIATQQSAD